MPVKPNPVMKAMVDGKSDEEILTTASRFGGPQVVTSSIVLGLADAVGPDAPDAVVAFVAEDGDASYEQVVRTRGGVATVEPSVGEPDAVYTASFPDLVRVAAGVLDLPSALVDGRITLRGDADLARRVMQTLVE